MPIKSLIFFFCCILSWASAKALELGVCYSEEDTLDINNLREVVVTSFKQQRDIRLEPVAASIIKAGVLEKRNVEGVKDLSAFVPNLFMPDYGSKLTSPVFIRGIGSKINSPSVGLYVDGIPYFEKSAFDFEFTDIESVEVLRGPQGTLYGRNTMGGIINVSTRPIGVHKETRLKAGYGSYNSVIASASHSQRLSNAFSAGATANYESQGGYITNIYTGKKANGMYDVSARLRLDWNPSEKVSHKLSAAYAYSSQDGYPYALANAETMEVGQVEYDGPGTYRRNMATVGLISEYKGNSFAISNRAACQHLADHQLIDQDFSAQTIYLASQRMRQNQFTEELLIKSTKAQRYKWLFGIFGFYQGIKNNVGLDYCARDFATSKLYDNSTFGGALFHQSTIDNIIIKGLDLTFGVRLDMEWAKTDYKYYRHGIGSSIPEAATDAFKQDLDFRQLCPKFAVQYMFPFTGLIYASVTKGYKSGGFNTSFDNPSDRTYKPETSWNYEIGAKHPFLDDRCNAEVTFFYIDWRSQQIYQSLASQTGQLLRNAGKSLSKGVEVSFQYNPVAQLLLQANYGYTHATFKHYEDQQKGINYDGNKLPLVPQHTLGLDADYTFHNLAFFDTFIIGLNYTNTGKIYWREDNKAYQKAYGLLNAKISVTIGKCGIQVWARNITSTKYTAYYFESGGKGYAQRGRPFMCGINLLLKI